MGAIESLSRVLGLDLEVADEQLFVRAAGLSSDLIYVYDARDRRVLFRNQPGGGWPAIRLGLDGTEAAVHPDDRPALRRQRARLAGLPTGVAAEIRVRVATGEGGYHWLTSREVVLSRASDGTVRRVLGVGSGLRPDVPREPADERRNGETRYRSLVAATSAIVWTANAAGRFVEPQPSWEAFTGQAWPAYARAGRLEVVHPDDRRMIAAAWAKALRERVIYETDGRIWHAPSGEYRHCWTRAVPMIDAHGELREWVGCVLDMTDRHRAEAENRRLAETLEQRVLERTRQLAEANQQLKEQIAERRQAEEALRQSQKIEAVGQLTGGVAHDFNNLLTIILGNLELMERAVGDGMALKCLRSATHAAERGAKLAEQLLAFSRKQRLSPKPTDVNRLIGGVLELLRRSLGATVEVETQLDPAPWPAMVDGNQIELVLLNLAINARDAMGDRGTLTIATSNVTLSDSDDPELPPGDYVRVGVTDTGTGMSEEVRARAFEPFFTTKEVGKGSGLGLSMVYGVAKQLGGSARIDSRLGEGTTIVLHLPRATVAAPAPVPRATVRSAPEAQAGAKVLLVDDDSEVRAVTAVTLRGLGHAVIERADGEGALAALAEHADIALLLVDWGMPRMDGIEVARRARAMRPGLAVLLCTGYGENGPFAGQMPGDLVLKKPYRAHELAASVRHALEVARRP